MAKKINSIQELVALKEGYILNAWAPNGTMGNTIHPAGCSHIPQMKVKAEKIWAPTKKELKDWLSYRGGKLDPVSPYCSG